MFQGKCADEPSLPPSLQEAKAKTIQIATQLGRYQRDCGLAVDPHEYASTILNFGLMEVRCCDVLQAWHTSASPEQSEVCELAGVTRARPCQSFFARFNFMWGKRRVINVRPRYHVAHAQ